MTCSIDNHVYTQLIIITGNYNYCTITANNNYKHCNNIVSPVYEALSEHRNDTIPAHLSGSHNLSCAFEYSVSFINYAISIFDKYTAKFTAHYVNQVNIQEVGSTSMRTGELNLTPALSLYTMHVFFSLVWLDRHWAFTWQQSLLLCQWIAVLYVYTIFSYKQNELYKLFFLF